MCRRSRRACRTRTRPCRRPSRNRTSPSTHCWPSLGIRRWRSSRSTHHRRRVTSRRPSMRKRRSLTTARRGISGPYMCNRPMQHPHHRLSSTFRSITRRRMCRTGAGHSAAGGRRRQSHFLSGLPGGILDGAISSSVQAGAHDLPGLAIAEVGGGSRFQAGPPA
jgi:hypothetical protein